MNVCPPHGANTVLNEDLVRLEALTLTGWQREELVNITEDVFFHAPHREFEDLALSAMNLENLRSVVDGYQSLPENYNYMGLEIKSSSPTGQLHSPFWDQTAPEGFYSRDRHFHYIVELPEDIRSIFGEGSLEVELETRIHDIAGWREEVSFLTGSQFRFHAEYRSWAAAEAVCVDEGGHLASLLSAGEVEEANLKYDGSMWVGATDREVEGEWRWVDGQQWRREAWREGWKEGGAGQNCGYLRYWL